MSSSIAEYLLQLRTQGDLQYERKKEWCKTFLERNLELIRVGLNVESLAYDDIYKNLLLYDGEDYKWLTGPLSKSVWEASEFASEYRAGLPEEFDEADVLARFPPPNNGRATLVFDGDTVEILGSSNFKFPASLCSIQHPEGGRVECDLEEAASLYTGLADRIGTLLRHTLRSAVLDLSRNLIDAHVASVVHIFPPDLSKTFAEDCVVSEAIMKLSDAEKDRLRDRFVETILSSDDTYAFSSLSPVEKEFIRVQTPFCM
jgi:hypothetical protein